MKNFQLPPMLDLNVFDVNENFDILTYSDTWGDFLVIDNFWKNPKLLNKYAMMMPTCRLAGIYDMEHNGKEFYDGRSYYVLPKKLQFQEVLEDIINQFFNLNHIEQDTFYLANNLFSLTEECYNNNKNNYYAPHVDGDNVIACITYLNDEYEDTDGTGIFSRDALTKNHSPWVSSEMIGFLPAKFNRLIIYEGSVPHASIINRRWITEVRHSMLYFMMVDK